MLGKVGVTAGVVTTIGSSRAQTGESDSAEDTLEELSDLLNDVNEEVVNAQRAVERLRDTDGIAEFLGESDADTTGGDPEFNEDPEFDSDPEFNENPEFDSDPEFNEDPEFDETPAGQGTNGSTGLDLSEVDDGLVINGVPIGRKDSLADLTEAERERLEGVRINGVVIGEEPPPQQVTGNQTAGPNQTTPPPATTTGNATLEPNETAPGPSGTTGNQTTPCPTSGAHEGGSRRTQLLLERRLDAAEAAIGRVEDEADRALEIVEDLEPFGLDVVERELRLTQQLLLEVQRTVETLQETFTNNLETAADTLGRLDERLADRIDGVEDAMAETEDIEVS